MADTGMYLILGLVAVFGLSGVYIASIWLRYHQALKDILVVEELQEESTT